MNAGQGRELEIKLNGAPAAIERALRAPRLRALQQGRARARTLESVYFDTPDAQLRNQGVGLRLRRQGRRWIQTLKRERTVLGGLHDRDEIEHLIAADVPDLTLYEGGEFEPLFAAADLRQRIQPVFRTQFRRISRQLRVGETRIEAAYDRGDITLGDRHESLCELELELHAGGAEALFALADALCTEFGLRLDARSKAGRGYALSLGESAAPVRARAVALLPSQSVSDAFVAVAAEGLRQLQDNATGVVEGEDPEYVHQARVALRRLRAAIALFQPALSCAPLEVIDGELRNLGQALGAARDWDVFCLETLPGLPAELDVDGGRAQLEHAARSRRDQAGQFARDAVSHPQFTRLLLSLAQALQSRPWDIPQGGETQPAPPAAVIGFAREALALSWRRVARRAKRADRADPDSYHALRIALKRMRYGGEYFSGLFPGKSTRQFLGALAQLQDRLGRLNDIATLRTLASTLRGDCHDAQAHETLGALRGYYAGRMTGVLRRIDRDLKMLRRTPPFWS